MTDAWGYTEDDSNDANSNAPKALREALKSSNDTNKELMARLVKLEENQKRITVADLFESQGVARSAAQHYQGDADPEKVTAWVNDLRSAFGAAPATQTEPAQPVLTPEIQNQYERMNQAGQGGAPSTNMNAAMTSVNDAQTPAQLIEAFRNLSQ